MKLYKFLLIVCLVPIFSVGQDNSIQVFNNLLNKTWEAEGNWEDGSKFKQKISFELDLENNLVIAKSDGFVDKAQTKIGARNHGIRQFDKATNTIKFWEFDLFGGVTSGTVLVDGKNMLYQYKYGESIVTDSWEYVDDNTYNFKVGSFKNGKWEQIYLSTKFVNTSPNILSMMSNGLSGTWKTKAWDGLLEEDWIKDKDGFMKQTSKYTENGKVLYKATSKIELVNNQLILFSVIKDNNPKIFKSTSITDTKIVFENSDYKNPSKVIYEFIDKENFKRTIIGIENDKPSKVTFKFKKQ